MKKYYFPLFGGFSAIWILSTLTTDAFSMLMAPFGATCVIVFVLPDSPLAQPRNVIGGHAVSTAVGLAIAAAGGSGDWAVALGVGLAIGLMLISRTLHPPAGADPIVVLSGQYGWGFLLAPVLLGAVCLVGVAYIYHKLVRSSVRYPKSWM